MIMDTNKTNDLYLSRVLYLSATKIFCREKTKAPKMCMCVYIDPALNQFQLWFLGFFAASADTALAFFGE